MSSHKGLSTYTSDAIPDMGEYRFGIVISEWNTEITTALANECRETLEKHGALTENIVIAQVPGAFELPVGAKLLLANKKVDAVICIGCVIKGETKHNEYISNAVATGITQLSIISGKPVVFGVLTPDNEEQAQDRSGGKYGNKGVEAATTAMRMVALAKQLKEEESRKIGF